MTIQEAIDIIDQVKPNSFSDDQKKRWLSEVDGLVYRELLATHEYSGRLPVYRAYDQDTPMDTDLLVPFPYTDVYLHYMEAKMDKANAELQKYANSRQSFNAAYNTFSDYWTRTHMPLGGGEHFTL